MKRRNPPVVHWLDIDGAYLCIKAFGKANPAKATKDGDKVTCKKCRRKLRLDIGCYWCISREKGRLYCWRLNKKENRLYRRKIQGDPKSVKQLKDEHFGDNCPDFDVGIKSERGVFIFR